MADDPAPDWSRIKDFALQTLAPLLGVFTSELLALGPVAAVLESRRQQRLGELNPIPFPLLLGNCVGWVVYSAATRNAYIFASNVGGVLLAVYYLLSACSLTMSARMRTTIEALTVTMLFIWCVLGFVAAMLDDKQLAILIIGVVANVIVFLLFASPLTTFGKVISSKDSSSINRPFAACQIFNCALWLAYGIATQNVYVTLPNFAGLLLGIIQVLLIVIFPALPAEKSRFVEALNPTEEGAGYYGRLEDPAVRRG